MSYIFEYHETGAVDLGRLDADVPDRERHLGFREKRDETGVVRLDERGKPELEDRGTEIEPRIHGPARRFLADPDAELDPRQYAARCRQRGTLCAFPTREEWATRLAQGQSYSVGDLLQRCMEELQKSVIREEKLIAAIEALEAKIDV